MNKIYKILLPILLIAMCASCEFFSSSEDDLDLKLISSPAAEQKVTFNGDTLVFRPDPKGISQDLPPFMFEIENQKVEIKGYFLAYSISTQPKGEIVKKSNQIIITINYKPGPLQADMPRGYFYSAYISGLEKETYKVKIIHKNDLFYEGEKHEVFSKDFVID